MFAAFQNWCEFFLSTIRSTIWHSIENSLYEKIDLWCNEFCRCSCCGLIKVQNHTVENNFKTKALKATKMYSFFGRSRWADYVRVSFLANKVRFGIQYGEKKWEYFRKVEDRRLLRKTNSDHKAKLQEQLTPLMTVRFMSLMSFFSRATAILPVHLSATGSHVEALNPGNVTVHLLI